MSSGRRSGRGGFVSLDPRYPNANGRPLRGRYIRVKSVLLHAVSRAESERRIDVRVADLAAGAAERAAHEPAVGRAPQKPHLFQRGHRRLAQLLGQISQAANLRERQLEIGHLDVLDLNSGERVPPFICHHHRLHAALCVSDVTVV